MKTKPLPAYSTRRPRSPLAKFIRDYEPEGIRESDRFRRDLVRVLNTSQGVRWHEVRKEPPPANNAR